MSTPKPIRWRQLRYHWELYLFALPTLFLIGLFQYYPAASGVIHSFYRWNGADVSEWVGWDNYIDLLRSTEFGRSFNVALLLGACNVIKMIPAIIVAVCVHRCRSVRLQFLYRTLFVVPMVIPGLVVVLIWRSFFFEATGGYLNRFLYASKLFDVLVRFDGWFHWGGVFAQGKSPAWLGDPRLILAACIVWGFPWVGSFAVLTHLAKLQGISKDIYEAAEIDGVGWWSKFTRIELPLMMSSISLLLVFVVIDTLKDAGMILALAGIEGGPGGTVTVPALFMIRKGFLEQSMGYACAIGIVLTVIVMALQKLGVLLVNWRELRRWQRATFRGILLVAGAMLVWHGLMVPLGVAMAVIALPIRLRFNRAGANGKLVPDLGARAIPARSAVRRKDPVYGWRSKLTALGLRFGKHLALWIVLGLAFLPLFLMVIVSLKSNRQFYEAPGTLTRPYHWENWRTAWDVVIPTVANSIFIAMSSTALVLITALSAAYFFARARMPLSRFFWDAILILMMMPTIANLIPLFRLLGDLNLLNTLSALIIVGASAGQVFAVFVLRSFVADIPQELFEAAEIDGASHWRQMMTVVLPLSGPILGTVGVMHFVGAWNEFVLPLIVIRDQSRLPVMVQLLRMAGEYIKYWGPLMAGYAIASIPIIVLFIFTMKLFVRGMTDGAVKG